MLRILPYRRQSICVECRVNKCGFNDEAWGGRLQLESSGLARLFPCLDILSWFFFLYIDFCFRKLKEILVSYQNVSPKELTRDSGGPL